MVIGIGQGGSVTVIYGMLVVLVCLGCSALTMAELSSVYPTAGGPYHWTSILAPVKANRILVNSYTCAFFNFFGWISITAGVVIQPGQFIEAMRIFFNPDLVPSTWEYFLFYQAVNVLALVHNIFLQRRIHWVHDVGLFLTGVANPNFMFAGIDGAVHLAEEVTGAAKTIPRSLISTIVIGFTTAFAFTLAMLYSLNNFDEVLKNATGVPIYEIWYQAT
ncbi:hypothetical protein ACHAP8_010592 [Fusarium lateritium]